MLASGISNADITEEFPLLEEDDIKTCLLFAAKKISIEEEIVN